MRLNNTKIDAFIVYNYLIMNEKGEIYWIKHLNDTSDAKMNDKLCTLIWYLVKGLLL